MLVNEELAAAHRTAVAIGIRLACTEAAWRSSCVGRKAVDEKVED